MNYFNTDILLLPEFDIVVQKIGVLRLINSELCENSIEELNAITVMNQDSLSSWISGYTHPTNK